MVLLKRAKNFAFFVLLGLGFLNILAWSILFEINKPRLLEVNFFDVGQGDAILIVSPQKHQILIDGGPNSTILEKLAKSLPFYDKSLDLIILTHPERDHLAGLIEVLKSYKVDYILWTGATRETAEYQEWQKLIEKEGATIKIAKIGQKIKAGKVYFDIFSPLENLEGKVVKDSNNTSIIARLVFGENSFLFTGDVYKSEENKLIEREIEIDSDILKISHHGSKTSSDEEFIMKVSPEIAVISVGRENKYGHPHLATLETLNKYSIKILRTDLDGDIKFLCNSQSLKPK